MAAFRFLLLTTNWVIVALAVLLLLTAGLVSPGHDKGRLIPIAFFVIVIPVIGYGIHRFILWLFALKTDSEKDKITNG